MLIKIVAGYNLQSLAYPLFFLVTLWFQKGVSGFAVAQPYYTASVANRSIAACRRSTISRVLSMALRADSGTNCA
jgi:hypothetical protein